MADFLTSDALFSKDNVYRYFLSRIWDLEKPTVVFCMLNPSTADNIKNDPTVERCQRRAKLLGYGSLVVINLFALKSTDPGLLFKTDDPVGPENDTNILKAIGTSDMIICAWGQHGSLKKRDEEVLNLIKQAGKIPYALKLNKDGSPAHPLYLPYSLNPVPLPGNGFWTAPAGVNRVTVIATEEK